MRTWKAVVQLLLSTEIRNFQQCLCTLCVSNQSWMYSWRILSSSGCFKFASVVQQAWLSYYHCMRNLRMKLPGMNVWQPLPVNWPIKKDDQLAAEVIKRNLMTRNSTEGQKKYTYGLWCPSTCSAGRLEAILCPGEGMAWSPTPCFRARCAGWGVVWKGWVLPGEKKMPFKVCENRKQRAATSSLTDGFVVTLPCSPLLCVWSHMMVTLLQQL